MSQYSIKDLERISGIKAHTIRIWEQRYHLLDPDRTVTNIRCYSDDDLKVLLNVTMLNQNGFKISKIAAMNQAEMYEAVEKISITAGNGSYMVDQLILSAIEINEDRFEDFLDNCLDKFGFEDTCKNIIFPFLTKLGILWMTNSISPAQEHFISNLIRQKILSETNKLPRVKKDSPIRTLLFLPENELHEISLLLINYLLRKKGISTVYLGQSVPLGDLKSVADYYHPQSVITVLTCVIPDETASGYLQKIKEILPGISIFASGYRVIQEGVKNNDPITVFHDPENILALLLKN